MKDNNYKYEVFEDTGTGKAYANLLVLDLSLLSITSLPFVIHDSFLFKNIENDAVTNLIKIYEESSKQTFISIDEIRKYGDMATKSLSKNHIVKLSDDKVLYIKDWRKNK